MYRRKICDLMNWKVAQGRKPLVLTGMRRVGKTWLVREFGRKKYETMVYVNFREDPAAKEIFEGDLMPIGLITALGERCGVRITPEETLVVLDDVQECPRAIMALENFSRVARGYHIIAVGSPVRKILRENMVDFARKVELMTLLPMDFAEFLMAQGKEQLARALEAGGLRTLEAFHGVMIESLRRYLMIGGMPEAVGRYMETDSYTKARIVQQKIMGTFIGDFSRYIAEDRMMAAWEVFDTVPRMLARKGREFEFDAMRKGASAADYADVAEWLEDTGVARRVYRVRDAKIPLLRQAEKDAFKMFLVDVGLLGALVNIDPEITLAMENIFEVRGGMLTEQFAAQELVAWGRAPYYYSEAGREADLMIESGGGIAPIEVRPTATAISSQIEAYLKENPEQRDLAIRLTLKEHRPRRGNNVRSAPIYTVTNLGLEK